MLEAAMSLSRMHITRVVAWWFAVTVVVALTPLFPLHAQETFPYVATVQTDNATVHGGPQADFYTTDRLPRGTEVEVYRHEQDGWCAIRPPATSFSWVPAEHLEITDNPTLARVINIPVKTRVGSNFDDVHDVEYISLRQGEIVELLGSKMLSESSAEDPVRWFKIAPPAGEFRWIHSRALGIAPAPKRSDDNDSVQVIEPMAIKTYQLPADGASLVESRANTIDLAAPPKSSVATNSDDTGFTERDSYVSPVSYEEEQTQPLELIAPEPKLVTDFQTLESFDATPIDEVFIPGDAPIAPASPGPAPTEPVEDTSLAHVNVMTWEAVSSRTDPLAAPEPRGFVEKYNALNVMLSRAILGDIESWKLDKLQEQTLLLVTQAQAVEEQNLAQALADKVAEFQSLQKRSGELANPGESGVAMASNDVPKNKPLPLPEFDAKKLTSDRKTTDAPEMPQRIAQSPLPPQLSAAGLRKRESIDNSVFEASGTLVAVQARRAGLPKYALTDRSGAVVKFLSTKDGSSLSHLVNKEVGVLGKEGYMRSLKKSHVVAERVVVLQR